MNRDTLRDRRKNAPRPNPTNRDARHDLEPLCKAGEGGGPLGGLISQRALASRASPQCFKAGREIGAGGVDLTKGGGVGGDSLPPSVAPRAGFAPGSASQIPILRGHHDAEPLAFVEDIEETADGYSVTLRETPPPWFRGVIRKPGCTRCGNSVVHVGPCAEGGTPSPPDGGPVYLAFDAATGADVSYSFCPYCLRGDGRHLATCAGFKLTGAPGIARGVL